MKFKSSKKGSKHAPMKKIRIGRWVLKKKIGTIKTNAKTLREH